MRHNGRERIYRGLFHLAQNRPLDEITVSALIAESGVNRATFYYHFKSVPGVLEHMMEDFCQRYLGAMIVPSGRVAGSFGRQLQLEREIALCEFVADHTDYIRFYLNDQHYVTFKNTFERCFYRYVQDHRILQLQPDGSYSALPEGAVRDYFIHVLFFKYFAYLELWTRRDFREGPEDWVDILNSVNDSIRLASP